MIAAFYLFAFFVIGMSIYVIIRDVDEVLCCKDKDEEDEYIASIVLGVIVGTIMLLIMLIVSISIWR